jgi:tryptophan 2,3-dioxygenase
MNRNQGPVYYGDYLKLNDLCATQKPLSVEGDSFCHDEMLFIVVHQVYELWFKQIIHDMKSIHTIFNQPNVSEKNLGTVLARLERIKKIQGLLLSQLEVMETMTPMDFLEFRDLLIPASGFQSVQFREIEVMMGLSTQNRESVDRDFFLGRLNEADQKRILDLEKLPSLFDLINAWLERLPFTQDKEFNFWNEYQVSVKKLLQGDREHVEKNFAGLSSREKNIQLENIKQTEETFADLFDKEATHTKRLSKQAILNGLFIFLYRDEPIFQIPHMLLTALMDIDENFTTWRYRHAMMAHRMLGTKIGTGGSSGHLYLKRAAENNRVYTDLFDLSTYLVPKTVLPEIPNSLKEKMKI